MPSLNQHALNGQMFQTHDSELEKECTCPLPHSAF